MRCGHAGHVRRCTKEGGIGCQLKLTKRKSTEARDGRNQQGGGKRQRQRKKKGIENESMSQPTQNERPQRTESSQNERPTIQTSSRPASFMRGGRNVTLSSSLDKWSAVKRAEKEKNKNQNGKDSYVNI